MKKMIRVSLCLSIVLVLFSILGGCSKVSENSSSESSSSSSEVKVDFGGRTINFAAWMELAPKAGTKTGDEMVARSAAMETEFNCKIKYLVVPFEQYLNKLITTTMAGTPFADIAAMRNEDFLMLVKKGYLTDLGSLAGLDLKDDTIFHQGISTMTTIDNKPYGYVTGKILYPYQVFFWNKSLFERDNLPNLYELQEKGEWTWAKMREIAKSATKDTNNDGKPDQWGISDSMIDSLIASNNAMQISMTDNKFIDTMNSAPVVDAYNFYSDICTKDKTVYFNPDGTTWDQYTKAFGEGKIAMISTFLWLQPNFKDMKDDYGIVTFPKGPNATEYATPLSAVMMCVPKTDKDKDKLGYFITAYSKPLPSAEGNDELWRTSPAYADTVRDNESLDSLDIIFKGQTVPQYYLCFYPDYVNNYYGINYTISRGLKTPGAAIDEFSKKGQGFIDNAFKN